MIDTLPTVSLIVNQTVTLTVQQDIAWVCTILFIIGVVSVINGAIEWKDEIVCAVKGWVRRG